MKPDFTIKLQAKKIKFDAKYGWSIAITTRLSEPTVHSDKMDNLNEKASTFLSTNGISCQYIHFGILKDNSF